MADAHSFTAMLIIPCHETASLFKTLLARIQIEVVEWAAVGTEWVTSFQKHKPEFLIVDYVLPKRDGVYCLQKAFNVNPACKGILIHGFSGFAANELELKAFSAGASGIVQMPLVTARFEAMIERLVEVLAYESTQKQKMMVLS